MSNNAHSVESGLDYAEHVVAGSIKTGKLVRLACERHLADLDHGAERGLTFDYEAAQGAIRSIQKRVHTQGDKAGERLLLSPFQCFITLSLYGWMLNGVRRFREAYIEVGRKNGKSTFFAANAVHLTGGDNEPGARVLVFANTKDQGREIFDPACDMIKASDALSARMEIYGGKKPSTFTDAATGSKCSLLACDAKKLDGKNVHAGLGDELHEQDDVLWNVIKGGTASRSRPLMLGISTAGFDRRKFGYKQHVYAQKVLEGLIQDDRFFGYIACLDDGDDWQDESNWIKSNPNLGISVTLDFLRIEAQRAKDEPASLNNFLCKHMNIWTEQQVRWMHPDKWKASCLPVENAIEDRKRLLASLKGCPCFGGLDLSQTQDLTAFVLLFPPHKDRKEWIVIPWFFVPEENIRTRAMRDRVPYNVWKDQGFLIATPGSVIDYRFIRAVIERECKQFVIKEIAYDKRFAQDIVNELADQGITCVDTAQGYRLSGALNHLYTLVLQKEINHAHNPVLAWNMSNMVVKTGAFGDIAPDKANATERIDGAVALAMAVQSALINPLPKRMPTVHVAA